MTVDDLPAPEERPGPGGGPVTAIRFEIIDVSGTVQVDNGMLSAPEARTAEESARLIASDFPTGWTVRLWKDVDLFRPLDAQGEPRAVVVNP
jgi:hypothetical protein